MPFVQKKKKTLIFRFLFAKRVEVNFYCFDKVQLETPINLRNHVVFLKKENIRSI